MKELCVVPTANASNIFKRGFSRFVLKVTAALESWETYHIPIQKPWKAILTLLLKNDVDLNFWVWWSHEASNSVVDVWLWVFQVGKALRSPDLNILYTIWKKKTSSNIRTWSVTLVHYGVRTLCDNTRLKVIALKKAVIQKREMRAKQKDEVQCITKIGRNLGHDSDGK